MSPNGGGEPEGELMAAIQRDFGSFDAFKAKMSAATIAVQEIAWTISFLNFRSIKNIVLIFVGNW